jgi:hypothetical protein
MSEIMSNQHYSLRQVKLSDPVFHRVFKACCHVIETARKVDGPTGHYTTTLVRAFQQHTTTTRDNDVKMWEKIKKFFYFLKIIMLYDDIDAENNASGMFAMRMCGL